MPSVPTELDTTLYSVTEQRSSPSRGVSQALRAYPAHQTTTATATLRRPVSRLACTTSAMFAWSCEAICTFQISSAMSHGYGTCQQIPDPRVHAWAGGSLPRGRRMNNESQGHIAQRLSSYLSTPHWVEVRLLQSVPLGCRLPLLQLLTRRHHSLQVRSNLWD